MQNEREIKRISRHQRIRKSVSGSKERPRLCVHRSLKNFYAQVIDDTEGKVLFAVSTLNKDLRLTCPRGGNKEGAMKLGEVFAAEAKKRGISKICFDRGGYIYHGRVKAFADTVRAAGLEF